MTNSNNTYPVAPYNPDDKNESSCRCNCCIYWRRHVHRVAANRDSKTGRANVQIKWLKGELAELKLRRSCSSYANRRLLEENKKLKQKKRSIFNRLFG